MKIPRGGRQITSAVLDTDIKYEIDSNCLWSSLFGNDGYKIGWSKSAEFLKDSQVVLSNDNILLTSKLPIR